MKKILLLLTAVCFLLVGCDVLDKKPTPITARPAINPNKLSKGWHRILDHTVGAGQIVYEVFENKKHPIKRVVLVTDTAAAAMHGMVARFAYIYNGEIYSFVYHANIGKYFREGLTARSKNFVSQWLKGEVP